MSGSGGGGIRKPDEWRLPSDTGAPGEDDECDIVEETVLNSPNPEVVSGLEPGQRLSVVLVAEPRQRVVAMTASGQIAGSITFPRLLTLIECIGKERSYEAEVLRVDHGLVLIRVSSK